jgi:predicted GNAT family N-acyltransferase
MTAKITFAEPHQQIVAPKEAISVSVARSLDELMQVMSIRSVVYMGEQLCPYAEEFDGNDFNGATHLIARIGLEPVGVMRVRWFADFVKFERFAVLREQRGGNVARALFDAAFELASRKGYRRVLGYIQARLAPFMRRVGGMRVRAGRSKFVFSDHEYIEVERMLDLPPDAITIDTDPLVMLRPEGAWDRPGVLDRSAARPATNPY